MACNSAIKSTNASKDADTSAPLYGALDVEQNGGGLQSGTDRDGLVEERFVPLLQCAGG